MKPKIRTEDEHEAWYIYLVFLEAHLSKCERNVREYENPDRGLMYSKEFYKAQVMAATAARDAVEKEVRKWQEAHRIEVSEAEHDSILAFAISEKEKRNEGVRSS